MKFNFLVQTWTEITGIIFSTSCKKFKIFPFILFEKRWLAQGIRRPKAADSLLINNGPGRNISQNFSEFLQTFSQIFCRFWDIDEKVGDFSEAPIFYSFSELLPNFFFFNSQSFSHHFSDSLWFLNKTLTYRKAKNENIWNFSKALIFQIFLEYLEGSFEFFRFSQNCRVLSSAGFE